MSDFSSHCRTCLSEEAPYSLLDQNNLFLREILMDCACLQAIEGNKIPSSICKVCQLFLVQFDEFRNRCKQVDAILLENQQNNSTGDHNYSNLNRPPSDEALDSHRSTESQLQPTTSESSVRKLNRKYNKRFYRKSKRIEEESQTVPTEVLESNNNCTRIDNEQSGNRTELTIKELHFADRSDAAAPKIQKKKRRLSSYLCSECGYRALDKSTLVVHFRKHTGERPHACSLCAKQFTSTSNLRAHELTHGAARFVCEACGARLGSAAALRRHAARHAGGTAGYLCRLCRRLYTTRGNLGQHMRIHAGVKDHVCDVCGARFLRATDLRVHGRIHARAQIAAGDGDVTRRRGRARDSTTARDAQEQERRRALEGSQHACRDCGKVFVRRAGLISHMKRKKPCTRENATKVVVLRTNKIDTIPSVVNDNSDENRFLQFNKVATFNTIDSNNLVDQTHSDRLDCVNENLSETNNLVADLNEVNNFEANELARNQYANDNDKYNDDGYDQKRIDSISNQFMSQDVDNVNVSEDFNKKSNITKCIQEFYKKTFRDDSVEFSSKDFDVKLRNFIQIHPLSEKFDTFET